MICEDCGLELQVSMFPFCHGDPTKHVRQASSVNGDEIVGGFVQENFGHQPEIFYSKHAMAKRAKQLHLEPMVRCSGPNDKHVKRMDAVSPYQLEQAAILITRVADQKAQTSEPDYALQTVRTSIREVTSLEGL